MNDRAVPSWAVHIIMKVNGGFRPTQSGDPNSPAATFRGRDD
jgi:hypothetical protein